MGLITISANLNDGDDLTLNKYLRFKIYGGADNYTTPIITTGSSVSDPDVDVLNNEVTIRKEVGNETNIKVTAIDENGNESILSNGFTVLYIQSDYTDDNYI